MGSITGLLGVIWFFCLIVAVSFLYFALAGLIGAIKEKNAPKREGEPSAHKNEYSKIYHARTLLTNNELRNYYALREITKKHNLLICPKVRLLDLVQPKQNISSYRKYLYKVQSKHVDFVICDQDMNVLAVVELDDRSHLRSDRRERDKFVDAVLTSCGYKIIHTWAVTEDILDPILPKPEEKREPTYEEWKAQRLEMQEDGIAF